jgi:hypothetical protein
VRVSGLIACVIVAADAQSRGTLGPATTIGMLLGYLVLLALVRRPRSERAVTGPRPPTRLDVARWRYVRGDITVEEFESQVADLLAHGRADRPVDMLLLFDD